MSNMDSELVTILGIVTNWLKFAEAKNFGLLTFCGVIIAAIISFLSSTSHLSSFVLYGLLSAIALLGVSCLISLISFLPRINIFQVLAVPRLPLDESKDNYYFFRDLCKYQSEQLTDVIAKLYYQNTNYPTARERRDLDIANQIIVNATITNRKYMIFSYSLYPTILAVFIIVIVICVRFIFP